MDDAGAPISGTAGPTTAAGRPKVVIIGPVPPPAFGVAKATKLMLDSPVLAERLDIVHMDTSDVRGVANIGKLDRRNALLGVRHLYQLTRILAKERPDVILLTASQGALGLSRDALFVAVSRVFGSKIVAYLRGSKYAEMRGREGWLAAHALRFILKSSSRVIVLGQNLVGMAHEAYQRSVVAVVPNGCPPAVPAEMVGCRDEERPMVLYIGRLGSAKGIEEAVRAARGIADAVPTLEFVLCGEWEPPAYEAEIGQLVADLGLSHHLRFPGATVGQEKQEMLARAWVLVVPSHSEGHPWVILEAMSAGVPVVATSTGAIPETVEDGVTGFVVPVGDAALIAQRVVSLLQDGDLWRRASRASRERYEARFTVERSHGALADELCRVARGG